jgi:hypothetical protein
MGFLRWQDLRKIESIRPDLFVFADEHADSIAQAGFHLDMVDQGFGPRIAHHPGRGRQRDRDITAGPNHGGNPAAAGR